MGSYITQKSADSEVKIKWSWRETVLRKLFRYTVLYWLLHTNPANAEVFLSPALVNNYMCSLFKDKLSECFVFILLGYHVSGAVLMQMDETLLGAFNLSVFISVYDLFTKFLTCAHTRLKWHEWSWLQQTSTYFHRCRGSLQCWQPWSQLWSSAW